LGVRRRESTQAPRLAGAVELSKSIDRLEEKRERGGPAWVGQSSPGRDERLRGNRTSIVKRDPLSQMEHVAGSPVENVPAFGHGRSDHGLAGLIGHQSVEDLGRHQE
jgi:hypothetical protein